MSFLTHILKKKHLIQVATIAVAFFVPLVSAHALATANVTVTPATVESGDAITIAWNSTDTVYCVGTGFNTGGATNGSVTVPASGSGSQTKSVVCYDDSPACTLQKVGPEIIDDGSAGNTCSSPTIQTYGASCFPNGGSCMTSTPSGGLWKLQQYECQGGCSTVVASDNYTVVVSPPPTNPTATINVTPSSVPAGGSVTVSWSSTDTTQCVGTNFSTNGQTSGSRTITNVQSATTYSVTCDGIVTSSVPGTWQKVGPTPFDIIDLWCPLTRSTIRDAHTALPACPTSNHTFSCPNGGTFGCSATNSGDPTGLACTGSESCKITWASSCNVLVNIYRCNGGAAPTSASDSDSVTVLPPLTCTLDVDEDSPIPEGTTSDVTWTTTNVDTCSFTQGGLYGLDTGGAANGTDPTDPLFSDIAYEVTCTALGGTVSKTGLINVIPATDPLPFVDVSDNGPINQGDMANVTWTSTNANSCTFTVGSGDGLDTAGAVQGADDTDPLTVSTPYTVTCTGPGGSGSDSGTITVVAPGAPSVNAFDNGPIPNNTMGSVTWTGQNVDRCYFTVGTGAGLDTGAGEPISGTDLSVNITTDTPYTVECEQTATGNTVSDSGIIEVGATVLPTVNAHDDGPVASGQTANVTWTSTNANNCSFTLGSGAGLSTGGLTIGSDATDPLSAATPYTVTCTGPGGSASDSGTIQVLALPTVTAFDDGPVATGEIGTVTWTSTNAQNCTFTQGNTHGLSTGGALNGSDGSTALVQDRPWEVTCTNVAGSDSDSGVIRVGPGMSTFAPSKNPVIQGDVLDFIWGPITGDNITCTGVTVAPADDGGWAGSPKTPVNSGGSQTGIGPISTGGEYQLSCTNPAGSAQRAFILDVVVPVATISAQPQQVLKDRTTVISWEAQNVQGACTLDADGTNIPVGSYNGPGYVGTDDNNSYNTGPISAQTTYRITCPVLPAGSVLQEEVLVTPFIPDFEEQ